MGKSKKSKYYAYVVPLARTSNSDGVTGKHGVCDTWNECAKHVLGVTGARFMSFESHEEAEVWLKEGGEYAPPKPKKKPKRGIYFDAGTGRGNGVEISVTDEHGKDLLIDVLPKKSINKHGKHLIRGAETTNNYGELLACKYALQIALRSFLHLSASGGKGGVRGGKILNVFGDSALVINFWSKGHTRDDIAKKTIALAREVGELRREFEAKGGKLVRISGGDNPADLGFH